jgi:hypothetical protein
MALLLVLGWLLVLVGGIWLAIGAFRVSILWGLGVIFVPFVSLVFLVMQWEENKRAFFISLAGGALLVIGIAGTSSRTAAEPVASTPATVSEPVRFEPPPQPAASAPAAGAFPQVATKTYEPEPEPEISIKIEQVWADNASYLYYGAKCKKRPENAYPIAKSVAIRQGFKPAPCN